MRGDPLRCGSAFSYTIYEARHSGGGRPVTGYRCSTGSTCASLARATAVVGPNGSGKTTLIKSILGLTTPDAGEVLLDGRPVRDGCAYRARIGYMPQEARFPENLSAREVIDLLKDLRGRPADTDEELVEAFGLEPEFDKPLRTLSGGNRQKVSAVLAFLFRPDVFILDEPTAGLDPVASAVLKDKAAGGSSPTRSSSCSPRMRSFASGAAAPGCCSA